MVMYLIDITLHCWLHTYTHPTLSVTCNPLGSLVLFMFSFQLVMRVMQPTNPQVNGLKFAPMGKVGCAALVCQHN